ncbi:MAG: hypothetical protein ACQESR_05160 [Planctomycetota bacterium]
MNECQNCCQKPEELEGKPEECSPEQIRHCHGDVTEHPCVGDSEDEQVSEEE